MFALWVHILHKARVPTLSSLPLCFLNLCRETQPMPPRLLPSKNGVGGAWPRLGVLILKISIRVFFRKPGQNTIVRQQAPQIPAGSVVELDWLSTGLVFNHLLSIKVLFSSRALKVRPASKRHSSPRGQCKNWTGCLQGCFSNILSGSLDPGAPP